MPENHIHPEKSSVLHPGLAKFIVLQVPIYAKTKTLGAIVSEIEKSWPLPDGVDCIYATESDGRLAGSLPVAELFRNAKSATLEKVMHQKIFSAHLTSDPEKLAHHALKHGIDSIIIVDAGKPIGVITAKGITKILDNSLRKDLFRFAGIHHSHLDYENSMGVPLGKSIFSRFPWLVCGIFGIIFVAAFMGGFEEVLKRHLILAFFVPAVVYASGSLGTQIQTILIRDFAIMGDEIELRSYFIRQMAIAFLISVLVCGIFFTVISVLWRAPYIAFVISCAMLISLIITSLSTFTITVAIKKFGFDPALGGGPFATVVSDGISILVYFIVASALL